MSYSSPELINALLSRVQAGDRQAQEDLYRLVYRDLHQRAQHFMAGQPRGHSLQATELVHECFLRLAAPGHKPFVDREHFLSVASRAMRHILVDHARKKNALKRAAKREDLPLDLLVESFQESVQDLQALDEALKELAEFDPRMCEAVEWRFFGGATWEELRGRLNLNRRELDTKWDVTMRWLKRRMGWTSAPESFKSPPQAPQSPEI